MALGLRLGLVRTLKRVEAAGSSISPVTVLNGQTSSDLTVPSGIWLLSTVLFGSSPTPSGILLLHLGILYETDGVDWYDGDFNIANSVSISGTIKITNNSGATYTFWDIPPP